MALYRYLKNTSQLKTKRTKKRLKTISFTIFFLGFIFLINAIYPIVHYQLFVSPRFSRTFLTSDPQVDTLQNFGFAPSSNRINFVLGEQINPQDLTQPSSFVSHDYLDDQKNNETYFLSIPKLKIEKAIVKVGVDLKNSLAQYPGTAVPGHLGNTVIFGHSVLPQFFNPKNYLTIFSNLPTLRPGDEIYIDLHSIRYKYIVEQMIEVVPEDIAILAQRYDDSYLSLITCVPPGTYLKRLIVRARLAKY